MINPAKKWSLHKRRHNAPEAEGSSTISVAVCSGSVLVTKHQSLTPPNSSQVPRSGREKLRKPATSPDQIGQVRCV